MRVRTFDKAKDKKVMAGSVIGNEYHRTVTNAHYMVKHRGYGIQSSIFSELISKGVQRIVLHTKTGVLSSWLYDWTDKGVVKDYGHGAQIFLPVDQMKKLEK